MIKAVLFDMDGTITDTEKIYNRMWQEAAHRLGLLEFSNDDALYFRSLNRKDAAAYVESKYPDGPGWSAIHDLCVKLVRTEMDAHGVELKPGVHEILSVLKERNIKSAIVTATDLSRAIPQIERVGLKDDFDEIISAHEAKRGKPYPEPYLFACERIGLSPAECIAVEDSPNGCSSAIAAGCPTIMVPDLTPPDDELRSHLFAVCETLLGIEEYL